MRMIDPKNPANRLYVSDFVIEQMQKIPTIEAEPLKHGRWVMQFDGSQSFVTGEWDENYYIECSECGRKVWYIDQDAAMFGNWEKIFEAFPYCHCGAKMDGGTDNEVD